MKKIIYISVLLVIINVIVAEELVFRYNDNELILTENEKLQFNLENGVFNVNILDMVTLNKLIYDLITTTNYQFIEICDGIDNDFNGVIDNGNLCNDGLYCNGIEICGGVLGCLSGTKIDCNDGIDCSDDVCNEELNKCENILNDDNCLNNEICTINGCEILPSGELLLSCPMEDRYKTCDDGTTNSRLYLNENSDTVGKGVVGNGHIAVANHQTRLSYSTSNHIDRYEGTIEFFVRIDTDVSATILEIRPNNDNTIKCSFSSSDNKIGCGAWGSGVGKWSYIYSNAWNIGEWHSIKITYSTSANEMNVYYDNVLKGTKQFAGFDSSILDTGIWLNKWCSNCAVSIDEFKIWDYSELEEIPEEPPEPIEGIYAITNCDSCKVKSINIESNTVNFEDYSDGNNMGKTTFILCGVNGVTVNFNCNNVVDSSENVWDSSLLKPKASYDNETWFLITNTNYDDGANRFEFSHTFIQDCVMISSNYYYPTYRMYDFISELEKSDLFKITNIGYTDLGKEILLIEGTDYNYDIEDKKHIWMIAGQHPQETSGIYQLGALLKKFNSSYGKYLFIHAVLIMNIDGMYLGLPRDDQSGIDLNRAWDDYSSEVVNTVRPLIKATDDIYGVDMFIDFHGFGGTTHLEDNLYYCSLENEFWNLVTQHTTFDTKTVYCISQTSSYYAWNTLNIPISITAEMSQINQDNNIAVFTANGEGFLDAIYEYYS